MRGILLKFFAVISCSFICTTIRTTINRKQYRKKQCSSWSLQAFWDAPRGSKIFLFVSMWCIYNLERNGWWQPNSFRYWFKMMIAFDFFLLMDIFCPV